MEPTGSEPTVRTYGPASQKTVRLAARTRRFWLPVARAWRMTPRGVRLLQRVMDPTEHVPVLRGTRIEHGELGGVPVERIRARRAGAGDQQVDRSDEPVILYFHGGGYVFGSPRTHRNLVSRLSHVTGLPAVSVGYRLPPRYTLPAPVEDALAVYRALLGQRDASRIVVAGDSAGGNLAHELVLHAVEAGLPAPAGLVLLSPWSDLSGSGASMQGNAETDPFVPEIGLRRCARVAVGGGDPAHWRVSPLFAPDGLQGQVPPTLVQVGTGEVLRDDGERVARRLAGLGVPVELELYEGTLHVVPAWSGTPEARDALHRIAAFVRGALPAGVAPERSPQAEAEAGDDGGETLGVEPPLAPGSAA